MAEESKNVVVKSETKKQKPKRQGGGFFSGIGRRIKETWSELKKVTWPTFPTIVKSLGVVFAVTAIFLVVLLGFDLLLLYFVYNPLTSGTIAGSGTTEEALRSVMANISGFLNAFRGIGS